MTFRTFIAAIAIAAGAAGASSADPADRVLSGEVTLPGDVLLQIAALWEHGERYEPVIRAVIAEHAKPHWGWGDGCDETSDLTGAILPSS